MTCLSRLRTALLAVLLAATGSSAASAAGAQPVAILAYHHIGAAPRGAARPELWVPRTLLRRQLAALARAGYLAVTLDQVWRAWHGAGTLPAHPVVLSFDDGYASQAGAAASLLRAHRWPGVLNLQVARLDAHGGISRVQVRRLIRDGWEIDAHTLTHPDLTTLDGAELRRQVAGSRQWIRRRLDVPAAFFCYPAGRYDSAVIAAVRAAGFLGATTENQGPAGPRNGMFTLDRVRLNRSDGIAGLSARLR